MKPKTQNLNCLQRKVLNLVFNDAEVLRTNRLIELYSYLTVLHNALASHWIGVWNLNLFRLKSDQSYEYYKHYN
jgi:hypothetical protein